MLPDSTLEFAIELDGVVGHVDEYSTKLKVGLEKKSTSTYPTRIQEHHNTQAEYYFSVLKALGFTTENFFVVYYLKTMDSILPQVYPIAARTSSIVIDELMSKKSIVQYAKATKTLPPPTFCDECGDCQYVSLCFGNLLTLPKETVAYYSEESIT
jgi:hypothetical protein